MTRAAQHFALTVLLTTAATIPQSGEPGATAQSSLMTDSVRVVLTLERTLVLVLVLVLVAVLVLVLVAVLVLVLGTSKEY